MRYMVTYKVLETGKTFQVIVNATSEGRAAGAARKMLQKDGTKVVITGTRRID